MRRLCHGVEMWLVRELWHILDDSQYYLQRPDALWEGEAGAGVLAGAGEDLRLQQVLRTLRGWEQIRLCTDLSGLLKCCWIGDGRPNRSSPKTGSAGLVARYEWLSALLDARIDARAPLANCFRDVAALAAALETALVLTQVIDQEPPAIAQALGRWGVPCRQISSDDRLCALESAGLSQVLVQAGVAKLAWAGLRLAVLHVVAPGTLAAVPLAPELAVAGEGGARDLARARLGPTRTRMPIPGSMRSLLVPAMSKPAGPARLGPPRRGRETVRINHRDLVVVAVAGQIAHPVGRANPYRIGNDGVPRVLPATGGIAVNQRIGDRCVGLVSDHIEPGVTLHNNRREVVGPRSGPNDALITYACAGNRARVISGPCTGKWGVFCKLGVSTRAAMVYRCAPLIGRRPDLDG